MADLEKLHIKLGLSGTYWDKRPSYRISVNDQVYADAVIGSASDEVEYIEFDVESITDSNVLKIELLGKDYKDTIQNADKTAILKDMLLNIVSIEIDEIDLGQIPFNLSEYRPLGRDDVVKNCVNLGWNGAWTLTWTNPFYIWLLENM
jgi:hypothetical protein